jgi:dipeptidyl aminopeptidase/acylaminoacyl peptidase
MTLLRTVLASGVLAASAAALAQDARRPAPLPLDVAVSLHAHNGRSSFGFSPDGAYVAHTEERDETVAKDSDSWAKTGKPFAEGDARMQAVLTDAKSGEPIRLGGERGSSWAPVFSPDGSRVAFYADDDGECGLWIWEKATGKAERFSGVIARPFFGFEVPRFSADGRRVLCKVLPQGMSVAEANALVPASEEVRRFPEHKPDEESVLVHVAHAKKDKEPADAAPKARTSTNRSLADLAILDLATRQVTRVLERGKPRWYAFSPDESRVAFTDLAGYEPDAQQPLYDVAVYDVKSGATRKLASSVRLGYGIEVNWSPDGRRLAWISSGQRAKGECVVCEIDSGATRELHGEGVPSFDPGEGEHPPLWDAAGANLFAIGTDGKLWRVDAASGKGAVVAELPNRRIRAVVTHADRPTLWTTDGGRNAWVVTREKDTNRSGVFRIDLVSGGGEAAIEEAKSIAGIFNVDGCDATGEIAYVAKDQQHPGDVWVLDPKTKAARQASHLNPALERHALGVARLVEWRALDGAKLKGTLLLPPDRPEGRRLPLVVWVYGGANGSNYVNSFGFWGDLPTFNMHVLATRGYAVFFPDAPLGEGTPVRDLVNTVMPGVNAVIEQGYADPDRLAVMGQSYGSYCSLALVAQTKRFKAAVITACALHPDLVAGYLEMSPDGSAGSTGYYEHGQGNMHATPWERPERWRENSPLFLFDRIETPVLMGQGDQDGRLIGADATFVALRRLGKEVEYRIYEGEGHVITRRANVLDFWNRRLAFLEEHLDLVRDDQGALVFDGDRAKSRPQ